MMLGSRATQPDQPDGTVRRPRAARGDVLPSVRAPTGRQARRTAARAVAGGGSAARDAGPHASRCSRDGARGAPDPRFIVTPESNRMGYRLDGPRSRMPHVRADILSDATPIGSMQVPASGQPILLMADRQTTGGYPKIATVITADLPLAGPARAGRLDRVRRRARGRAVDALQTRRHGLVGASSVTRVRTGLRERVRPIASAARRAWRR